VGTALRRDRHRHLVCGGEDRLAELTVPGTVLLLDPEGRKPQLRAMDEGGDGGEPRHHWVTASPMVRAAT
jgi:hypothetical protein